MTEVRARSASVSWYPAFDGNTPILGYLVQTWPAGGAGPRTNLRWAAGAGIVHQLQGRVLSEHYTILTLLSVSAGVTRCELGPLLPATAYQVAVYSQNTVGAADRISTHLHYRYYIYLSTVLYR